MRVTDTQDHITHAVFTPNTAIDFTFAATAEMFHAFTDGLYSDKERAVPREVICNCWDSHIASGIEHIPIEINITSDDELNFTHTFRDFGSGIAPEMMEPLYGTIGGTTKVHDESQTGGFGLGCKSPFAKVEHFEVTSWYAGTKTIYRVTKSASENNGKPGIFPIVSLPCGDETGLEVKFKLHRENLRSKIKAVVEQGNINALLNGSPLARWDFEPVPGNYYWSEWLGESMYVRNGNVIYPIRDTDFNKLKERFRSKANGQYFRTHQGSSIIIQVPPGSISVTPSRESISMTPKTKENLLGIIEKAIEEFEKEIDTALEQYYKDAADKQMMRINPYFYLQNTVPFPYDSMASGTPRGKLKQTEVFKTLVARKISWSMYKTKLPQYIGAIQSQEMGKTALKKLMRLVRKHNLEPGQLHWVVKSGKYHNPERKSFNQFMPHWLWSKQPTVILSHSYYPAKFRTLYPDTDEVYQELIYKVPRSPKAVLAVRKTFENFPWPVIDNLDNDLLLPKVKAPPKPRAPKPVTFKGILSASYLLDGGKIDMSRAREPDVTAPTVTNPKWVYHSRELTDRPTLRNWDEKGNLAKRFIQAFDGHIGVVRKEADLKALLDAGSIEVPDSHRITDHLIKDFPDASYIIAAMIENNAEEFLKAVLSSKPMQEALELKWTAEEIKLLALMIRLPRTIPFSRRTIERESKQPPKPLPGLLGNIRSHLVRPIMWGLTYSLPPKILYDLTKAISQEVTS